MSDDLIRLTASEALARLRSGELRVETYAARLLAHAEDRETDIEGWSYLDSGQVLAAARALDEAGPRGPLHGLPIGIKDVILTRDMPTQYNSPIYEGHHPTVDAACVHILRAAGALIFGKTETVEFASTGRPAPTRNPRDLAHTPGGSSSGSAAVVADRHVPVSLGTQTGGSVIRPAAFCGIWGVKPTWGLISTEGCRRFAVSLDTLGWFARSGEDLGLLYDVLDPEPCAMAPFVLQGARIAICRTPVWDQAGPATVSALDEAARRLGEAGAVIEMLDLPSPFERLPVLQGLIMRAEGRSAFLPEYRTSPGQLHPNIVDMVNNAEGVSREDLRQAYDIAAACRPVFDALASRYDAVLAPSVPGEAPEGLGQTGAMIFNGLWTLLHTPCVNVPGLDGPLGLPVGLTVTGPRYADRQVLAAATAIGAALA